jgi:DNA modification methylase
MVKPKNLFLFGEMEEKPKILEVLPFKRERDEYWDFRDTPAGTGVYGIHSYPAMFHFLVVRELIKLYSKEKDVVLDPFMGSGVVGVECLISNRNFIGYDLNPLAILIAKVRITPLPQKTLINTLEQIQKSFYKTGPESISFHNINYWFDEPIIEDLSRLRRCILNIDDEKIKDFFKIAFSETVRKVSKTEYNEFKLSRKKKENNNVNVIKTFYNVAIKNIGLLSEFYKNYRFKEYPQIILEERNILNGIPLKDNSVNLIVTSPPYGDSKTTVAYGQFSRLSLRWLGLEENVDKESLGSKPKEIKNNLPSEVLYEILNKIYEKDKKRAKEVYSFYDDLFTGIKIISPKIKNGGVVCFVVGNRKVKGEELPTDKICVDFWESLGFEHEKTIVRAITNKRMPLENSPTNVKGVKDSTMKYEYIVILRKIA